MSRLYILFLTALLATAVTVFVTRQGQDNRSRAAIIDTPFHGGDELAENEPSLITPTLYCLGGAPCTSPEPSATTAPSGGTAAPNQVTTETAPPTSPTTTVNPCETESSVQHDKHKKHKKHRGGEGGGWLSKFFEFIMKLLEQILKLFGVPLPENPSPEPNPEVIPEPTTEEPDPNEPTPCPDPTTPAEPTAEPNMSVAPSVVPSVASSPTCGPDGTAGVRPITPPKCTINATSISQASAAKAGDVLCFTGNISGRLKADKAGVTYSGGGAATVGGIDATGEGVTVQGFVIQNATAPGIKIAGNNITVQDNKVVGPTSGGDNDGMRFFGSNLKILHNTISNIQPEGGAHADCMQTFATGGEAVATTNSVIDGNRCENIANIGIIMEGTNSGEGDGSCQGRSENITISNNYFDNGASDAVFADDVHNIQFINNEIVGQVNSAITFEPSENGAVIKCNKIPSGVREKGVDAARGGAKC